MLEFWRQDGRYIRLGIEAPDDVTILRDEVKDDHRKEAKDEG